MLIRLVGHYIDNPNRIDKLICIKGLPDEWFFRESRFGGKELIKPWEPDVEANIPKDCRALCEPFEITQVFSPIEKGRDFVVDKRMVSALRFDYMTEQGQTAWDQIERYLERSVPRDQMVPKPVLVAPDHKSAYSPHETRRGVRGSLELRPVESIPVIDLRPTIIQTATMTQTSPSAIAQLPPTAPTATITLAQPVKQGDGRFDCTQPNCTRNFPTKQALSMHVMRGHAKKVAAGV